MATISFFKTGASSEEQQIGFSSDPTLPDVNNTIGFQFPITFSGGDFSSSSLLTAARTMIGGARTSTPLAGGTLTINNASYNYETGNIDIANIRSGSPRTYINSYGVVGANFYVTGINNIIIDENIFLNGQRLTRDIDYVKVSSGDLRIRNAIISDQSFPFFTGETGFFNV